MVYDLIVIGGGPAGYTGAIRAGEHGLKTLLIEKDSLGGTCLNEGCIPTKTLLYSAKLKDSALYGEPYGLSMKDVEIEHSKVIARKNKIVKILTGGIKAQLKNAGAEVMFGTAKILGKNDEGFSVGVGEDRYMARKLLIATGSASVVPPISGLNEAIAKGFAVTSSEILDIKTIPKKLVVIGAGVIGLEIASYFQAAGSEVSVIERLDTIGGEIDSDISEILLKNLKKKNIKFNLRCTVTRFMQDGVEYMTADSEIYSESADTVLVSIGRRAFVDGVGLDNIGLKVNNGVINVDECMQTSVSDVYAAGDAAGHSMLAHAAYREAEVAVCSMTGINDTMRYDTVPGVIYTSPEVASVGETEFSATQKGLAHIVKTVPMNYSGRYMAENERGDGIVKLIVDTQKNTLIGVQLIGSYASEIISSAGILISLAVPIDEIKKMVFAHPTVGEIIREALLQMK